MVTTTDQIREYYDNFEAIRYPGGPNARHQKVFDELRKIVKSGMTVFDVGCGSGQTSLYMAEDLCANVTAIDLSPVLIQYAKDNNAHENVIYDVADITRQRRNPMLVYDVITIIDCLEHIPLWNHRYVFQHLKDYVKPETIIYINIPDSRFTDYMLFNCPEKLQIIDESLTVAYLTKKMGQIGFELKSLDIYGIDVSHQYNSYVFVAAKSLDEQYKTLWGK